MPALSEKAYTCAAEFEEEQTSEQSYFSAAQHLKIDYTGSEKTTDSFSKVINLTSNVRKVSIISDRRITVRASFVIQKRTEDIEFELENVVLHGLQTQQYAISYDGGYQASSGCLILKLFGIYNSVLSGYIAPKGEDGERSDWFQHGGTGGAGGEGGCGGAKGPGANSLGSNDAEDGSKGTPVVGEQIIIKGSVVIK